MVLLENHLEYLKSLTSKPVNEVVAILVRASVYSPMVAKVGQMRCCWVITCITMYLRVLREPSRGLVRF